jgi:formylglycine-generating enzyme
MRMASRAEHGILLVFSAAAVAATLGVFHGCDSDEIAAAGATDAAGDERVSRVADGSEDEDASPGEDACARVLNPSIECTHPPVTKACDGGWCRVTHGCFIMGSPPCEFGRGLYSEDQVQVTLTHDFEIQQTEMTQAQWVGLGFSNPSKQVDGGTKDTTYGDCLEPGCPLGNVALEDVMAAANKLSEQGGLPSCYALAGCTGDAGAGLACTTRALTTATTYECLGYRLPTEAEWEYAARAGTKTAFYDGDVRPTQLNACEIDPVMDGIGWYCFNAAHFTRPVGQKKPNAWGLFDMAGNAAEWTTSAYTGSGFGSTPLVDPMPQIGAGCLVLRGGLVTAPAEGARSASRSLCGGGRDAVVGFRLVRTLP